MQADKNAYINIMVDTIDLTDYDSDDYDQDLFIDNVVVASLDGKFSVSDLERILGEMKTMQESAGEPTERKQRL